LASYLPRVRQATDLWERKLINRLEVAKAA
jgi:hypothetical protein